MNEKNDNANCLNEEPLITADQVCVCVCVSDQTAVCLFFRVTKESRVLHKSHLRVAPLSFSAFTFLFSN